MFADLEHLSVVVSNQAVLDSHCDSDDVCVCLFAFIYPLSESVGLLWGASVVIVIS